MHILLTSEFRDAAEDVAHQMIPNGKVGRVLYYAVGSEIAGDNPDATAAELIECVVNYFENRERKNPEDKFQFTPLDPSKSSRRISRDGIVRRNLVLNGEILSVRRSLEVAPEVAPESIFAWERIGERGRGIILTVKIAGDDATQFARKRAIANALGGEGNIKMKHSIGTTKEEALGRASSMSETPDGIYRSDSLRTLDR